MPRRSPHQGNSADICYGPYRIGRIVPVPGNRYHVIASGPDSLVGHEFATRDKAIEWLLCEHLGTPMDERPPGLRIDSAKDKTP